jgi:dCMP deaminase
MNEKWDERFLELAKHVAGWSRDPSTKVGAVIVRPDKTIASLGFNGFARGVEDREELYRDREEKYKRIIHADMNALLFLREPAQGMTMYTWPMFPCNRCAVHIIQAGIVEVVSAASQGNSRWEEEVRLAVEMMKEAGIMVRCIITNEEYDL